MTRANLRHNLEDWIERVLELLDAIDGDPDDEIETDFDINPVTLQWADRRPVKHVTRRVA
jgi:hypothetical protein